MMPDDVSTVEELELRLAIIESRLVELERTLAAMQAAVQRMAAYQGVAHLLKDPAI